MPSKISCRRDQILNPSTNRCVLRSGRIGKKVIADMAKNATSGDVTVRVGEIYTGSFMKSFVELQLSPAFFKTVTKRPKILRNKRGNAYVFGPLFQRLTYKFAGHHYNDGAQTGIVLMDKNMNVRKITHEETWDRAMFDVTDHWEDPRVLRMVRKELSKNIIFVGETDGGDGGADVYIHRNRLTNKIDSIIIDNGEYFF